MKVYIRKHKGKFSDDWLFAAYLGFKKKGCTIRYFSDIEEVPFALDNVVVTGVEESIRYFEKNNIPVPPPLNIPDELNMDEFLGRKIKVMSMLDFKNDKTLPIFVKPHSKVKEFSSGTLTRQSTKDLTMNGVPDDSLVLTSEIVEFLSEYRCFVYKGKLVGIRYYQGDFELFPYVDIINEMISKYKSGPIAYTLDVGIVCNNLPFYKTLLVEAQDFWSIGHYGFSIELYSSMLRDRWFEIIRNGRL